MTCFNSQECVCCNSPLYLRDDQKSCGSTCPDEFFTDDSDLNLLKCSRCLTDCNLIFLIYLGKTCTTPTTCQECMPNKYLTQTNDECVTDCGIGKYEDDSGSIKVCSSCITDCIKN